MAGTGLAQFQRLGAKVAGDDRPVLGEEISVGALRKFFGEGEAAIAFVEVAGTLDVLVVLTKGAVIGTAGVVVAA